MSIYNATTVNIPRTLPVVLRNVAGPWDLKNIIEAVNLADERDAVGMFNWEAGGVLEGLDPSRSDDATVQKRIDQAKAILDVARQHNAGVRVGLYAVGVLTPYRYNDIRLRASEWRQDQARLGKNRGDDGRYHGRGLLDTLPTLYPTLYQPRAWRGDPKFHAGAEQVVSEVADYCQSIQKPTVPFIWHEGWSVEHWRWYLGVVLREFGTCAVWAHPDRPIEGDYLQAVEEVSG